MTKLVESLPISLPQVELPKETTLDRIYAWYMEGDESI